MSKTNLETMNLVFCIKMSLPYFLPKRSKLGYTLFYAGSEQGNEISKNTINIFENLITLILIFCSDPA